jgi:lipopolysaccharide transport system permease protein
MVNQLSQLADNIASEPGALPAEASVQDQRDAGTVDSRPPVLVLGSRQWTTLELRDVWSHRELFYILAWRDVKVRYKQSALGVAWVILQPLLTMIIFTLLFGRLAKMPSEGKPYAIFSYAGLLPWTFFAEGVTGGSNSLINSSNLITKVYFPRLLIPAATVGACLVDFTIASLMLFVIMPLYHVGFHLTMLMFFPLAVLMAAVTASVAIFTSAMNVKYRDIRHALPFAVQLWMFLTPVIYPVSFLPAQWRWLLKLNPLSGIIEGFRAAIFGGPFDWPGLAISAVTVAVLMVVTCYAFRRMERHFADVI